MENSFFQKNKFIVYSSAVVLIYFIFLYSIYFYDEALNSTRGLNQTDSPYKLLYLVELNSPITNYETLKFGTKEYEGLQVPEYTYSISVIENCNYLNDFTFKLDQDINFKSDIDSGSLTNNVTPETIEVVKTRTNLLYYFDFKTNKATPLECNQKFNVESSSDSMISPDNLIILDEFSYISTSNTSNGRTFFWLGELNKLDSFFKPNVVPAYNTVIVNGRRLPKHEVKLNPFITVYPGNPDIFNGITLIGWIK